MGVRVRWSIFVLQWLYVLLVIGLTRANSDNSICHVRGCNCTYKATPWKSVNCTLDNLQEVNFTVPRDVVEVFIVGGNRISLGKQSVSFLNALSIFHIQGANKLIFETGSFYNISSPNLLIRIQNCDYLTIQEEAFENVPVNVEIEKCDKVVLHKAVFSKLGSAIFRQIGKVLLSPETFKMKYLGSVGPHGPVTTIMFDNATIPKIPRKAFFSTLASVEIRNSFINEVETEAFWSTTISSIAIINSRLDVIKKGSFSSGTLINTFRMSTCIISRMEEGSVMAPITNITVEHSSIRDIETGAINTSAVNVDLIGNQILNIHTRALILQTWTRITIHQNIIQHLYPEFLVAPKNPNALELSFTDNAIQKIDHGALNFVPDLEDHQFIFQDNVFNQTCHCFLHEWVQELITSNSTSKIGQIIDMSFCVTAFLSKCFEITDTIMNMRNFTEMVCVKTNVVCEPYNGETKVVDISSKMFSDEGTPEVLHTNWIPLIGGCSVALFCAIIGCVTIMSIRGGRWLKRKGYFRNMQYNQNEASNDEENTTETVDESYKLEISEDLTIELLQDLSKKLDDPDTHQEASEKIEQLYQRFIRNTDNNQNEEEAHLYEELGNLQTAPPVQEPPESGARSILRMMEERFNTQFEDIDAEERPALGDYSEPSDAAVHLYSELKQNKEDHNSLGSRGSHMAFRPLPDMPGPSSNTN